MELDDWQKQVLETQGNIVLRAGRQVGKSTVISNLAVDYAVKNEDKTVMIIAAVERQAFLLFDKCLQYMEENYKTYIKKGKDRPTKSRIKLTNGSQILCLPTGLTGNTIRGYSINILIADEAAFIPDQVFYSVTPALAAQKDSRIILLSTPFGKTGYFYQAFNDDTFSKFHISSEDCPRISKEFLEQERKRMTKLQYTQEYLGEFVDELRQFFPDALIKKCMIAQRPNSIKPDTNYFLGIDLARMGDDESTFEIVRLVGDKIIQVENQVTTRTYLSESTKHIKILNEKYNFKKIFIDDEGIGVGVVDHLIEDIALRRKVVTINNSKRVTDYTNDTREKILKEVLYNNLLRLMEHGQIELLDDPEIFLSLKSVQYEYTTDTRGKPHLKIWGSYTHIAEGLIRACECVKYKNLNIWIKSF